MDAAIQKENMWNDIEEAAIEVTSDWQKNCFWRLMV